MGVKSLVFLGLLTSAIFTYYCINSKKDAFYAIANKDNQPVSKIVKQPKIIEKHKPSFAYVAGSKNKIAALLSDNDKNGTIVKMINGVCGADGCIKDIKYFDDIKKFEFTNEILDLINHSIEKNIIAFAIYIDKNIIKVDGILRDNIDKRLIDEKLEYFKSKGYEIVNNTHIKLKIEDKSSLPKVKKSKIKPAKEVIINKSKNVNDIKNSKKSKIDKKITENGSKAENKPKKIINDIKPKRTKVPVKEVIINEAVIAPDDVFVIAEHISVEEASYRISDLLIAEPINFELDKSDITQDSKKTLDKVSDILLEQDNISIEVAGYTDASGDATYNKVLSQKRADKVRSYLIKSGIRSRIIRSVGYGSADLISDDPLDIINRRVEIHIKEGK